MNEDVMAALGLSAAEAERFREIEQRFCTRLAMFSQALCTDEAKKPNTAQVEVAMTRALVLNAVSCALTVRALRQNTLATDLMLALRLHKHVTRIVAAVLATLDEEVAKVDVRPAAGGLPS